MLSVEDNVMNWIISVFALRKLRCFIRPFLEDHSERFQRQLLSEVGNEVCAVSCEITRNPKPKQLPELCNVCSQWSQKLLDNHCAQGSVIHWSNCNPSRWPKDKWEVAKVYMPRGHKIHITFEDFDIAALINFISHCSHFHRLINGSKFQNILENVLEVRNNVMHSPDYSLSKGNLKKHLETIECLGQVLEPYIPEMRRLSEEINKEVEELIPEFMSAVMLRETVRPKMYIQQPVVEETLWSQKGAVVFGGSEVKPHSRPYMVSVQSGKRHMCGGTLISEDYVLTCAYTRKYSSLEVVLGAHNISVGEKDQQRISVAKCIPHPKYKKGATTYSLMLLKLKTKAKLNQFVKVLELPDNYKRIQAGAQCEVTGWGRGFIQKKETVLYEAKVTMDKSVTGKEVWQQYFDQDQMVCSFSKGFSQGDGGGPLVCQLKNKTILCGVASYTSGHLGDQHSPQVYMAVPYFLPWIREVLHGTC